MALDVETTQALAEILSQAFDVFEASTKICYDMATSDRFKGQSAIIGLTALAFSIQKTNEATLTPAQIIVVERLARLVSGETTAEILVEEPGIRH